MLREVEMKRLKRSAPMPKGDRLVLKADPEDGTTPIANLLLDAMAIAHLAAKEIRAVLYLWRRTYGWQINGNRLKEAAIPLSEWAKILNTDTCHASSTLSGLEKKNIINRISIGRNKGYHYMMNTRIAEWHDGCIDRQLLQEMATYPLPKNATRELLKNATHSGIVSASQKEILNKEENMDQSIDFHSLSQPEEAWKIWEATLKQLEAQVSKPNFRTWFKGTKGLGYKDGNFIVGVSNDFVAEYLDRNQRSLIKKSLIEVGGKNTEVRFAVTKKQYGTFHTRTGYGYHNRYLKNDCATPDSTGPGVNL